MSSEESTFDLQFHLERDENLVYTLWIRIPKIELLVEVIGIDLKASLSDLAHKCAEQLDEKGFDVEPSQVLLSISEAIRSQHPELSGMFN